MLKSMTGFGRAAAEAGGMLWNLEVASVNSRFLDVQVRMPRALAGAEFALRKRVGDRLARGKVAITVTWEALPGESSAVTLNRPLADAYILQFKKLQEETGLAGDITLDLIAGLPDLFSSALDSGNREEREQALMRALDEALSALDGMRATEGQLLGADIRKRVATIRDELSGVDEEAELYAKAIADKVQARVQQLFDDIAVDPQRLAQEVAFLAERADVTEERVRLAAHLDEFEKVLDKGGQVGRRFNFLLQEMVRETNTIGSKTGELSVIRRVVTIKEELEKIREQVQNLE